MEPQFVSLAAVQVAYRRIKKYRRLSPVATLVSAYQEVRQG